MSNSHKQEAALAALVLKGMLTGTPPAFQNKVNEAADKIRAIVAEYGDEGMVGLVLVSAEEGGK